MSTFRGVQIGSIVVNLSGTRTDRRERVGQMVLLLTVHDPLLHLVIKSLAFPHDLVYASSEN